MSAKPSPYSNTGRLTQPTQVPPLQSATSSSSSLRASKENRPRINKNTEFISFFIAGFTSLAIENNTNLFSESPIGQKKKNRGLTGLQSRYPGDGILSEAPEENPFPCLLRLSTGFSSLRLQSGGFPCLFWLSAQGHSQLLEVTVFLGLSPLLHLQRLMLRGLSCLFLPSAPFDFLAFLSF